MHGFLNDIGLCIIAATVMGLVMHFLRQPMILAYLAAGVFLGPEIGSKIVSDPANIEVISEIGLILLLFIIGLEMNPRTLLTRGKQILWGGGVAFLLCIAYGIGFFYFLGYDLGPKNLDAVYLAIFCALSSTAIVVKALYDKAELDTFHGRITIGILIFQDIWAILILALQPTFSSPHIAPVIFSIAKGAVLLVLGFAVSRYVLKYILQKITSSPELVVIVSVGWCVGFAAISGAIGVSREMGALIAGICIASFPYSVHVTAKVLPLRDFFLVLFFISLGMKITMPTLPLLGMSLVITAFVIVSRFLSLYPTLIFSGSSKRTSFITSVNLSQISEFSLVIAAIGVTYHHIHQETMSVILYAMAITSVLSSYAIKYNYNLFSIYYRIRHGKAHMSPRFDIEDGEHTDAKSIVVLGFNRGSKALIELLVEKRPVLASKILVIDFNTESLKILKKMKIKSMFGDISSTETLKHAHIDQAQLIICTVPDLLLKGTSNLKLVYTLRTLSPKSTIVTTADFPEQVDDLKRTGADEVILPHDLTGKYIMAYMAQLPL